MTKAASHSAYLEVYQDNGRTAFVPFKDVLVSVDLQKRVVDKRLFRREVAALRKANRLFVVPYHRAQVVAGRQRGGAK
jgi:hypothetical protein